MSVETSNPISDGQVGNDATKARVTKNVAFTLISQIFSWAMTFIVTLYVPRYLGAEMFGRMTTASSFLIIFGVIAPWGISSVLIKEIARSPERLNELISAALLLRVVLSVMMGTLALVVAYCIGYPQLIMGLLLFGVFAMVITGVNDVFNATLAGQERFGRHSVISLLDKAINSGTSLLLVIFRAPVIAFGLPTCISSIVQTILHLSPWHKGEGSLFKAVRPSWDTLRFLVRTGFPYLGQSAFLTMYGQTDPLVLSFVTNYKTVAWYNVAWKLVGTSMFLPVAIGAALLPTLTRLHHANDNEGFARLSRRALEIAMIIGVPIAVIFILVPDQIIHLLYTREYDGSIMVLRIGGICCLLYYITIILSTIVNAIERQKAMIASTIAMTLIGVPSCILFSWIGHHRFQNGATGTVISNVIMESILVFSLVRLLPPRLFDATTYWRIFRFILAALPMAAFLHFNEHFNAIGPWIFLPSGGIYVVGLVLFRAIDRTYIDVFRDLIKKRTG